MTLLYRIFHQGKKSAEVRRTKEGELEVQRINYKLKRPELKRFKYRSRDTDYLEKTYPNTFQFTQADQAKQSKNGK
jgi:hypothetical protein